MSSRIAIAVPLKALLALAVVLALSVSGLMNSAFAASTTGVLDTSFNSGGAGFNDVVLAVAEQPDGKILVGGRFTTYNGSNAGRIIRLNSDGSVDPTFNTGTGFSAGKVNDILLLEDGSMLVGLDSNPTYNNGTAVSRIAKISSTGVLDTDFTSNLGTLNGQVISIIKLKDGGYAIGGQFSTINGTTCGGIAKIDASGNLDTSFANALGTGFARAVGGVATVLTIGQLSSGAIVVGGKFDQLSGTTIGNLAALNVDGSPLTSFNTNLGTGVTNGGDPTSGSVDTLAIQNGNKILIGGQVNSVNGTSIGALARLNQDGTLDNTFNSGGTGITGGSPLSITIDTDEKIVIVHTGTLYNGSAATYVMRTSADGVHDPTLDAPVSGAWYALPINNGGIYVFGAPTSYKGTSIGRLLRLAAPQRTIGPVSQTISGKVKEPVSSQTLTSNGFTGTLTYSISPGLPDGLNFDTETGQITGTPTSPLEETEFTITASDGSNTATATIILTVADEDPVDEESSGDTLPGTGSEYSLRLIGFAAALLALGLGAIYGNRAFARRRLQ